MGDTPHVHQLDDDTTPLRVDRVAHLTPSGDLLGGVDPGRQQIPLTVFGRLRALRDDEGQRRALGVVDGVEPGRHALGSGAVPGHRRHGETVREGDVTQLDGVPKRGHEVSDRFR